MLRRHLLLTLAGVAAAVTLTAGQAAKVASFTATVVNVDAVNPSFSVDLLRWSTDAQRDELTAAFAKDEAAFLDVLKKMEMVGYLWTGEAVGYPIRYATRLTMENGSERIILVTDRPLGGFLPKPWAARPPAQTQSYPYAVIEIRMPQSGTGEGRISLAAKVAVDPSAKTLALENYDGAPVMLRNVHRSDT